MRRFFGVGRVVLGDVVDDADEVAFRRFGENDVHQRSKPCFVAMSASTSSAGRTRPSRAAARPS
jgi:hypothetical protein